MKAGGRLRTEWAAGSTGVKERSDHKRNNTGKCNDSAEGKP